MEDSRRQWWHFYTSDSARKCENVARDGNSGIGKKRVAFDDDEKKDKGIINVIVYCKFSVSMNYLSL